LIDFFNHPIYVLVSSGVLAAQATSLPDFGGVFTGRKAIIFNCLKTAY
jgi:hypothetical protein